MDALHIEARHVLRGLTSGVREWTYLNELTTTNMPPNRPAPLSLFFLVFRGPASTSRPRGPERRKKARIGACRSFRPHRCRRRRRFRPQTRTEPQRANEHQVLTALLAAAALVCRRVSCALFISTGPTAPDSSVCVRLTLCLTSVDCIIKRLHSPPSKPSSFPSWYARLTIDCWYLHL